MTGLSGSCNGSTNVWNGADHHRFHRTTTELPEVRLDPPVIGLYAERIEGAWYWVCGCEKCLGNPEKYSYVVCDEHNRCDMCQQHRSEFKEAVFGVRGGWRCRPCMSAAELKAKREALAAARASGHDEWDCMHTDSIICPFCASPNSGDEHIDSSGSEECSTCGGTFSVQADYSVTYTTQPVAPPTEDDACEDGNDE